jgi:hypothetical protein
VKAHLSGDLDKDIEVSEIWLMVQDVCPRCQVVEAFLEQHKIPYETLSATNPEGPKALSILAATFSAGIKSTPAIQLICDGDQSYLGYDFELALSHLDGELHIDGRWVVQNVSA